MDGLDSILISIIVPAYNCEKYIGKCIESICGQTHTCLEILLVDDGSTDRTGILCEEYASKDNRIKVLHKSNGGQQDARTEGIKKASGQYIGFIDGDDWIEQTMYADLLSEISDADLVTSGIYKHGPEDTIIEQWTDLLEAERYHVDQAFFLDNLMIAKNYKDGAVVGGISNNLVCKLFRSELVKEMADSANVHVHDEEDFLFTLLYVLKCREVVVTHRIYYHYRYNPGSIVNSVNKDFLKERTWFYETIMDALNGHVRESSLKQQFERRFLFSLYTSVGKKLGMDETIQYPKFRFPGEAVLAGKRVVVFGCGEVGAAYINRWSRTRLCTIVQWVDNRPGKQMIGNLRPVNLEQMAGVEFDFVICAVMNQKRADSMIVQLRKMNVDMDRILWERPVHVWREYFLEERIADE